MPVAMCADAIPLQNTNQMLLFTAANHSEAADSCQLCNEEEKNVTRMTKLNLKKAKVHSFQQVNAFYIKKKFNIPNIKICSFFMMKSSQCLLILIFHCSLKTHIIDSNIYFTILSW